MAEESPGECPGEDQCTEEHCEQCGMCGSTIEIGECESCGGTHCDSCDGDCAEEDD